MSDSNPSPRLDPASTLALYRELVATLPDTVMFLLHLDGRVMHWGTGAALATGHSGEAVLGEPYDFLFTPGDRRRGVPATELREAADEGRTVREGWRIRQDGGPFWAEVTTLALRDAEGVLTGFGQVLRDVSDWHRAKETFRQTDALKDQFIAVVSHELRTPINTLMGFGSVLQDEVAGPLNEAQQRYLSRMMQATDALLGLVTQLTDFSRLVTGRFALSWQHVSLEDLAREAIEKVDPLARLQDVAIELEMPSLPVVQGDRNRLLLVLESLLRRAVRQSPEHGRVRVAARQEAGRLVLQVRHAGGEPAEGGELFAPLEGSELSRGAFPLSGLGIAISQSIIEAHGGQIGVASSAGESVLWFSLPLTPRNAP